MDQTTLSRARLAPAFLLMLGLGLAPACGIDDLVDDSTRIADGLSDIDDHDDHSDDGPDTEACEHLAEGPALAVAAVSELTSPALADVDVPHTRYDVALTDVAGGQGGWVRLPVGTAGDVIVFLDTDIAVAAFAADGSAETPAEAHAGYSDACDSVAGRWVFELSVGETMLRFGPTEATTVSMVVEQGDVHDDEDADAHAE